MTTKTKERPILFSAPMVRAILDGRKTQTRRIVKVPRWAKGRDVERDEYGMAVVFCSDVETHAWIHCPFADIQTFDESGRMAPRYLAGTRLWVREWFQVLSFGANCAEILYADQTRRIVGDRKMPKRPVGVSSIHMPRQASRLTLEITEVRVERLNSITVRDAWAEGIRPEGVAEEAGDGTQDMVEPVQAVLYEFRKLWDTINGPGSWEANPWVWALTFRRIRETLG